MPNTYASLIQKTASILKNAQRVFIITGAGISAESGLPTYRGITGLYNEANTEDGIPIETALSGSMMRNRPELTWKYISQIENACRGKSFNRAHQIIAEWENKFESVVVFTQNIDGFHKQAGSTNIVDIHGNIYCIYCTNCAYKQNAVDYTALTIPPKCPECGAMLRPDVVLFEEMLDVKKLSHLDAELRKGVDIIFTIGTSSVFPYIAEPIQSARAVDIPTVEINPSETSVSSIVEIKFAEGAVKVLSDLDEAI